jgi:hypothetical protein
MTLPLRSTVDLQTIGRIYITEGTNVWLPVLNLECNF